MTTTKKIYASIWYHPNGKWKLDTAIIVDDNTIVGGCYGGSFYYGRYHTKHTILKDALMDLVLFNPDTHDDNPDAFEQEKAQYQVEFVSCDKMEHLIKGFDIHPAVADFFQP